MNKSYGLIMSAPMMLAYLSDMKSMTRRTKGLDKINENPDDWRFRGIVKSTNSYAALFDHGENKPGGLAVNLPYGFTGQATLYFKETYQTGIGILNKHSTRIFYKVDTQFDVDKWKSSMFMPRRYSRFQGVPITNVRVERLQDITSNDALAEGTPDYRTPENNWDMRQCYFHLWDLLNSKRGHPASRNDWVWVYEFPKYSIYKATIK
jgi:hypothetical protein